MDRQQLDLFNLARQPSNRVCADCSQVPGDDAWASSTLGVFLCRSCAGVHRSLGVHVSRVKSLSMDKWSRDEVALMRSKGNERVNTVLEYYAPPDLPKPDADADYAAREFWIKAKYVRRAFMTPLKVAGAPAAAGRGAHQAVLPKRLVDYFLVVAAHKVAPDQGGACALLRPLAPAPAPRVLTLRGRRRPGHARRPALHHARRGPLPVRRARGHAAEPQRAPGGCSATCTRVASVWLTRACAAAVLLPVWRQNQQHPARSGDVLVHSHRHERGQGGSG